MPRYSGELARQLVNRFIALYYFPDVFVHGVVKLLFERYLLPRLPPLNDCVVTTEQTFCVNLEGFYTRCFCSNSIVFILTVGLSYEDNCW